jgi:hypothetical protein
MLLIPAIAGLFIGIGLILGQAALLPFLQEKFGFQIAKPPQAFVTQNILLEANSDVLNYRASSFGIQKGSAIHTAIMSEQAAIMGEYQKNAAEAPKEKHPWKVETFFTLTAQAGPLSSVLRSDYIHRGDAVHRLEFASTLINTVASDGFKLQDIFEDSKQAEDALDKLLCEGVLAKKMRRVSRDLLEQKPLQCGNGTDVSFFDGPPTVFAQSTLNNQLGGLSFYFKPGRIGTIGEGEYIITLPQTDFIDYVLPAYQALFKGELIGLE